MSDNNRRHEESIPETPEEFVSLARDYFSNEFQTHVGEDCPSYIEIQNVIKSGTLPPDSLREHLFACSVCFVTYRELLQKERQVKNARAPIWHKAAWLLAVRRPLIVTAMVLMALAIAAVIYFTLRPRQEIITSVNQTSESVPANPTPSVSPSTSQANAPKQSVEEVTSVAQVDLQSYSLRRGTEPGQEQTPLEVRQGTTRFAITLPQNSPAGSYSVSVVDAFGNAIQSRTAHSSDGANLTTTLNLSKVRKENYRLCVSRLDEPPNCYPILITKRGK